MYTPTMEEIRSFWALGDPNRGMSVPTRQEAFDRALDAHDAEVFDQGQLSFAKFVNTGKKKNLINPYKEES